MSRLPRLHVPGAFYHVTARGNHRQDIFFRRADRAKLDEIMADALERTGARAHAYCWMSNHTHLLVQAGDRPVGDLMQRVGSRFARFVQKSIATTGHLFENRYDALLVDADSYFLELVRYIHLNPVRAGIVATPDKYLWSSHRVYLGKTEQRWIHTDFALHLFGPDIATARARYLAFVNEEVGRPNHLEIKGHAKEPRVFGDDRFLESLAAPVLRRHPRTTLERLTDEICKEYSVTLDQLRSASRRSHLVKARAHLARRIVDERVGSASDAARYLHRSLSALSRAVERYAPK